MTRTALYVGDNGRITCGALRCAGATAHGSGMRRDLSGQRLVRVDAHYVDAWRRLTGGEPQCEACGALHGEDAKRLARNKRQREARRSRAQAYRDCGMVRVRGALGGEYWE